MSAPIDISSLGGIQASKWAHEFTPTYSVHKINESSSSSWTPKTNPTNKGKQHLYPGSSRITPANQKSLDGPVVHDYSKLESGVRTGLEESIWAYCPPARRVGKRNIPCTVHSGTSPKPEQKFKGNKSIRQRGGRAITTQGVANPQVAKDGTGNGNAAVPVVLVSDKEKGKMQTVLVVSK